MADHHINATRRHLGELGMMAAQTERAERQILAQAEKLLAEAEERIKAGRVPALAGDTAAARQYQDDVQERGRLQRVIVQAKQVLAS